jgi:hypothetical protein
LLESKPIRPQLDALQAFRHWRCFRDCKAVGPGRYHRRVPSLRSTSLISWLAFGALPWGCGPRAPAHAPPDETPAACEERRRTFVELVQRLPDQGAAVSLRAELAESARSTSPRLATWTSTR